MGFVWSALSEIFYSKPEIEFQLVIIGFHNAGKTTIIRRLIHGESADTSTVPTIGLDTQEFSMKNVKLKVWDLSGQQQMQNTWKYYYEQVNGLVFVVDSSCLNETHQSQTMQNEKQGTSVGEIRESIH